jgi:anti-anti-sigma regulatory factor
MLQPHDNHSLIRLEREFTVASAAELKARLLEWLASGGDLQWDLESLETVDVTLLQVLLAAGNEAAHSGARITTRLSPAARAGALAAGFEALPGAGAEG